jgi:ATP-dependent helicase/DNAse subunit B
VVGEEQVITLMDKSLGASSSSDIIPLKLTKDCVPDKRSKAYPMEIMKGICGYADKKCEELIVRIMNGDIDCMPVTYDSNPLPCKYCDFASVCRIYSRVDGYKSMCYDKTDTEEILDKIKENSKPEN